MKMFKKNVISMVLFLVTVGFLQTTFAAPAQKTLRVSSGSVDTTGKSDASREILLDIILEGGFNDVNGVVFTLTYDKDVLDFVGLVQNDKAIDNGAAYDPYNPPPFDTIPRTIYYQANNKADDGEVLIAAASANFFTSTTATYIPFKAKFRVKQGVVGQGKYDILAKQTLIGPETAKKEGYGFATFIPVATGLTPDEESIIPRHYEVALEKGVITFKINSLNITGPGILVAEEASEAFTASGGTGDVTWTVVEGVEVAGIPLGSGKNNSTAIITPLKVGTFKLKATDASGGASELMSVTVVKKLVVTDKPTGTLVVESGKDSVKFSATGGDNTASYTWTVEGPVELDPVDGKDYTFKAPVEGNFAGVYKVTVTDGKGLTDSFNIRVPFSVTTQKKYALERCLYVKSKKSTIKFTINGTVDTPEFNILAARDDVAEVKNPDAYGTFTGYALSPAEISDGEKFKSFFVSVTIGEVSQVVGPLRFIGVVDYTLTVKDKNGKPLEGASVGVGEYYDEDNDLEKPDALKLTNPAGEAVFALPAIGVFAFTAEKEGYLDTFIFESETAVTLELEKAGELLVKGKVTDSIDNPIEDVDVVVYKGQRSFMGDTDKDGNYSISLPVDAVGTGWKAVASKDEYYFKSQVADLVFTGESVAVANLTLHYETELVLGVGPWEQDLAMLHVSIHAAYRKPGLTPSVELSDVMVYNAIDFNIDLPVEVSGKKVDGTGVSFPMPKEDFTILIKPGRDGIQEQVFKYIVGESVDQQKAVTEAGKEFENGKYDDERVVVNVPPGGISKAATLEIRTLPKKSGNYTNATPGVYVEINALDSKTGLPLEPGDIQRIELAIPFDTSVVKPGAFKAGKAFIYYAKESSIIDAGVANVVPTENIIFQDDLRGQAAFFLDHLTVFAAGTTPVIVDTGSDGDSSSGCFITTVAPGSSTTVLLAALIVMFAICCAAAFVRRK